jgi:large subunit ribosomal protein L24
VLSRIKIGDQVQVISGKDKGARGQILVFSKDKTKVKVRGIAMGTKFVRPSGVESSKGSMKKVERFLHSCKVMPICPETDKPCRVKVKFSESGKKLRVSHRSGAEL